MKIEKPLNIKELKSLKLRDAEEPPKTTEEVNICSFRLPNESEPRIVRNWQDPNSYQLIARIYTNQIELSIDQLIKPSPVDSIPVTPLNKESYDQFRKIDSIIGMRSKYAPASYFPKLSQLDSEIAEQYRKRRKDDDKPSNIFGADDRYIYNDSSFPWRTVGRIWTASGACTGCTIGPRLVLTPK